MEQLIKVSVQNDQQLVSARDLYKGLGIKRRFSAWWEQNSSEFELGVDYEGVLKSTPYNPLYSDKVQTENILREDEENE